MIDQQARAEDRTCVDDSVVDDNRVGPVARFDETHNVLWIGETPLPFRPGTGRDVELIELLGVSIRVLRGLEPDEPCLLRRSEFRVMAELLDLDDPDLRSNLRTHLGLSRRQAGDTAMQLRRAVDVHIEDDES